MLGSESIYKTIDLDDEHNVHSVFVHSNYLVNKTIKICKYNDKEIKNISTEAAVIGSNNTNIPIDGDQSYTHFWSNFDTKEEFLKRKPTSYLLVGVPGSGLYSMGEAIANAYQCFHISPMSVLRDEEEYNTDMWQALSFNLRKGKPLRPELLLKMVKFKLTSPSIAHRGYIMSGFPLVTSTNKSTVYTPNMFTERGIIISQNILEELLTDLIKFVENTAIRGEYYENDENTEVEEHTIYKCNPSMLEPCNNLLNYNTAIFQLKADMLSQQTQQIFELDVKPDYIFMLECPEKDMETKRLNKFINYNNNEYLLTSFLSRNKKQNDLRWPCEYTMFEPVADTEVTMSEIHSYKYNCLHPLNFAHNILSQIANYQEYCLQIIKNAIIYYKSESVFKLDGRYSMEELMHNISEKIFLLPQNPVLTPILLEQVAENYDIEVEDDLNEFWNNLKNKNTIESDNIEFNLRPSVWYNRCPVELIHGKVILGKVKYAVQMFNNVFLLSSLKSLDSFMRNPRPFLKSEYLKPTCRIIIIGSKLSGKTMTAECMAWILDGIILNFSDIYESEKNNKRYRINESIFPEIKEVVEEQRLARWTAIDDLRQSELENWMQNSYKYIKKFKVIDPEDDGYDPDSIVDLEFPFLISREQTQYILSNKELLLDFAPDELRYSAEKPPTPSLDDVDIIVAIENYIEQNDLIDSLEPTPHDVVTVITDMIENIEKDREEKSDGLYRYGKWIIDGFPLAIDYWNELIELKCIPDHVICIYDSSDVDLEILSRYKKIELAARDYYSRFKLVKDPLMKTKDLINNAEPIQSLDNYSPYITAEETEFNELIEGEADLLNIEEEINILAEALNNIKTEWEELKILFDSVKMPYIEIDINGLSDIEVLEEILRQFRTFHNYPCEENEIETELSEDSDIDNISYQHNTKMCLGETLYYCPIEFYKYNLLWEGKPEFSVKYDNLVYNFTSKENMTSFMKDPTSFQYLCEPFKTLPPLRICVTGCIGSGRTTLSKLIAKEMGLIHINFSIFINRLYLSAYGRKIGRQYENMFTDEPIDEDALPDFEQLDSMNIEDFNENMLCKLIFDYFETSTPLPLQILKPLLKKLWCEEPYCSIGFVLDGFPRSPNDLQTMTEIHMIPNVILQLDIDSNEATTRLFPKMFSKWKEQQDSAKQISYANYELERNDWLKTVTELAVVKLVQNEIINSTFISEAVSEEAEKEQLDGSINDSIIDEIQIVVDEILVDNPEPIYDVEWESDEDAGARINQRIDYIFETESQNLDAFTEIVELQKLKLFQFNGSGEIKAIFIEILLKLTKIRNRNDSFLEQTFYISLPTAETLLSCGYFFLSKFIRQCPVYVYEHPYSTVHMYKPARSHATLYAVIHRSYIYFLSSKENLTKFRQQPLKYVVHKNIENFVFGPLKIGIIGPTKSGQSSLTARLQKYYSFIPITKGLAIRYVIENMHWTKLAVAIEKQLMSGKVVENRLILEAIQLMSVCHLAWTQGVIYDGLPYNTSDAVILIENENFPTVIIDLVANENDIRNHLQMDDIYKSVKYLPAFSWALINRRHSLWNETNHIIRNWISSNCGNVKVIQAENSRCKCFLKTKEIIDNIGQNIHDVHNCSSIKPVLVENMYICKNKFQSFSQFKKYCPVCLNSDVLFNVDYRKGGMFIKYKNILYWCCSEHYTDILNDPQMYLIDNCAVLPKDLPIRIKYYEQLFLHENGICIVTYAENLPAQKIIQGDPKLAVNFKKKVYLFCSEDCLIKFMSRPCLYYDIVTLKYINLLPEVNVKCLPHLGYLEQTVGRIITDSCCYVNALRPKYPGLSVSVSGLISIALYLKTHNARVSADESSIYREARKKYESRCKLVMRIGKFLRSNNNPFLVSHLSPCKNVEGSDSGTVIKPSSGAGSFETFKYVTHYDHYSEG